MGEARNIKFGTHRPRFVFLLLVSKSIIYRSLST